MYAFAFYIPYIIFPFFMRFFWFGFVTVIIIVVVTFLGFFSIVLCSGFYKTNRLAGLLTVCFITVVSVASVLPLLTCPHMRYDTVRFDVRVRVPYRIDHLSVNVVEHLSERTTVFVGLYLD